MLSHDNQLIIRQFLCTFLVSDYTNSIQCLVALFSLGQGKINQDNTEADQNVLTKLQNQNVQPLDNTSNRIPLCIHFSCKDQISMFLIVLSLSMFVFPLLYLHSKYRSLLNSCPIHSFFFLFLLSLGNACYCLGSIYHLCTVNPQIYFFTPKFYPNDKFTWHF